MSNFLDTKAASTGVVVILTAGAIVYLVKRYGAAVAEKFDPTSSENLVNQAVSAVGAAASGNASWSLGGAIYDWANKNQYDLYRYSSRESRWDQVIGRNSGIIYNLSKDGVISRAY